MRKLFRTLALLLASLLAISMLVGCGGDDDTVEEKVVPANFVAASPSSGSDIAANGIITLTFDNAPADVTVSVGAVVPSGKTVTVSGPFTPGRLNLTVSWADGTQTLTYTVAAPCCQPPLITGGSIRDGDMDVDPEVINSAGKIEIIFAGDVTGRIGIITQAGEDVGWIGKVEGNKATLELVKGREIRYHMVYIIMVKVADALGNEVEFKIRFSTKANGL